MASRRYTFQNTESVSIDREKFLDMVVRNDDLDKNDLRVCLHLLTHLDFKHFKEISKKQIALDLGIKKSDVTESIDTLIYYHIIEKGNSAHVSGGYKFTF